MSKPHGEAPYTYHPHKLDDPQTYADNYDRIFKKGKYAPQTQSPPLTQDWDELCHVDDVGEYDPFMVAEAIRLGVMGNPTKFTDPHVATISPSPNTPQHENTTEQSAADS